MIQINLHKSFVERGKPIDLHLQAEWEQGKLIAIYGNSGAGKTSLLRMLSGLLVPDSGSLQVGDETWYNSATGINKKVNKRSIGYLFQDYSLFPNMNVLSNIQYALDKGESNDLVDRIVEIADLGKLLDRMPQTLSGGQQQRVALARAIVRKPKLLLLDEPLSALDLDMRNKLQKEILAIKDLIDTTIVFVSHHLPEVFKLADKVMVIEDGTFIKSGSSKEMLASMYQEETDTIGEVLSRQENETSTVLRVLVDGKIVGIELPK
jgi:molybdate transport system ATP-binding protein